MSFFSLLLCSSFYYYFSFFISFIIFILQHEVFVHRNILSMRRFSIRSMRLFVNSNHISNLFSLFFDFSLLLCNSLYYFFRFCFHSLILYCSVSYMFTEIFGQCVHFQQEGCKCTLDNLSNIFEFLFEIILFHFIIFTFCQYNVLKVKNYFGNATSIVSKFLFLYGYCT